MTDNIQTKLSALLKNLGLVPKDVGIDSVESLDDKITKKIHDYLVSPAQKSFRLNALYRKTEREYLTELRTLLEGREFKVYYIHHSHKMKGGRFRNAINYNTKRANGISGAFVTFEDGSTPLFGFTVCSSKDTYSRLIGRTEALVNLVTSFKTNTIKYPLVHAKDKDAKVLHNPVAYLNNVINSESRLRVVKPQKPVEKSSSLLDLNEGDLTLSVKSIFAEKLKVMVEDVSLNFAYVRSYENKDFSGQFATTSYLKTLLEKHPQDSIKVSANGGFTVGALETHLNGETIISIAYSKCLPVDTFRKDFGRLLTLRSFYEALTYEGEEKDRKYFIETFKITDDQLTTVQKLDNASIHLLAQYEEQSVNHYVTTSE